jgi:hypothetical protein
VIYGKALAAAAALHARQSALPPSVLLSQVTRGISAYIYKGPRGIPVKGNIFSVVQGEHWPRERSMPHFFWERAWKAPICPWEPNPTRTALHAAGGAAAIW